MTQSEARDDLPALIVDGLAVYRLTRLAIVDTLPPVRAARERILQRLPVTSWQAELLTCPWCLSVWIGAGVLLVRRTRLWRAAAFVLAGSAVSGALSERL